MRKRYIAVKTTYYGFQFFDLNRYNQLVDAYMCVGGVNEGRYAPLTWILAYQISESDDLDELIGRLTLAAL